MRVWAHSKFTSAAISWWDKWRTEKWSVQSSVELSKGELHALHWPSKKINIYTSSIYPLVSSSFLSILYSLEEPTLKEASKGFFSQVLSFYLPWSYLSSYQESEMATPLVCTENVWKISLSFNKVSIIPQPGSSNVVNTYGIIYNSYILGEVIWEMSYFLRCSCSFRKSSVLLLFTPELFL